MKFAKTVGIFSLFAGFYSSIASAAVIEATDKNIDEYLNSGVPTILDIYASWCGHCKRLSPVLDELAGMLGSASDKIQIVKIDGDVHRKTSKKWGIEYYPTVKFLDGTTKDHVKEAKNVEVRDLDGLLDFVTTNVPGVRPKKAPTPPSAIVTISDPNGLQTILNKVPKEGGVFAAFTSQSCIHCKNMKPEFEKLAHLFARDDDIAIVNIDCTTNGGKDIAQKYGVRGYPTFLYFSGADVDQEPETYSGGRTLPDFNAFITEKGVGFRNDDGTLNRLAGTIIELDDLIKSGAALETVKEKAQALTNFDTAKVYVRYIEKVAEKGASYVTNELARLEKLVKGNINEDKLDELQRKINILSVFSSKEEPKHKDL